MSEVVCFMPTYSPVVEADPRPLRPYERQSFDQICARFNTKEGRVKPGVYFDAIDSILNTRPDIKLVVGDARSTESIRNALLDHNEASFSNQGEAPHYTLKLYPEKMSQWAVFNDVYEKYCTADTKYFVYSSSDVIWTMDWVGEAIKAFEKDPKLQILFPCVSSGDGNIPCQVATGPRDLDPQLAPYDRFGKAPVLNAYAAIFRKEFLDIFGGYPDIFRNNYTESFLHYLCSAMGGEMRLLPRGWVYHWGTVDIWSENGSAYYYQQEQDLFQSIMNRVLMMDAAGIADVQFFKNLLWRKTDARSVQRP